MTRVETRLVLLAATLLFLAPAHGAEPEYPHGEFADDCTKCHGPEGWSPARISAEFDHAALGFRLEGAHGRADCRACHATLDFKAAASDCASCHLDPHEGEFGPDCAACHTARSFIDRSAMIRAHLATRLPLDGRHRTVDCEDCHVPVASGALQYVGLPVECYGCHSTEFAAAVDPDHRSPGFSRNCDRCHSTRAWEPARFNHSELPAGAQCIDCHLADYEGTANPDHETAGFSQQCEDCHTTTAWRPASFDHDALFPIDSGQHRGEWSECSDCHVNPQNYAVFSCIDCHEHDDPADLADKHDEVGGYVYNSQSCYACHPTGTAEDD
jgi:hypothetical protein